MYTGEKKHINACNMINIFKHNMHNTEIMDNTIHAENSQYTVGVMFENNVHFETDMDDGWRATQRQ